MNRIHFRVTLAWVGLTLGTLGASAAQVVLLAEPSTPPISADRRASLVSRGGLFPAASQIRPVDLPLQIYTPEGLVPGDELVVHLFSGVSTTARVDRVAVDRQGVVNVRGRFPEFPHGSLLISSRNGRTLISLDLPERAEQYSVVYDSASREHLLLALNASKMDVKPCGCTLHPPASRAIKNPIRSGVEAIPPIRPDSNIVANIRILLVYTPEAADQAVFAGGIDLVISMAMERAQLTMDNTQTGITLTLANFAEVDYVESGDSGDDLDALQDPDDGQMDIVHEWRDTHQADLVVLLANVSDVGGLAFGLNVRAGEPDYAFCLNRVQQSHNTYTVVHEIGHLLGCDHHKEQADYPGPMEWDDWPENTWSAGWRWNGTNNITYCDVMTYDDADQFPDDIPSIRVPYFSSPLIQYQGRPTGDPVDGDNARTIEATKGVVAAYRTGGSGGNSNDLVTVTVVPVPSYAGTVTGGGQFIPDANIIITATGQGQWSFSRWQDGNTDSSRSITVPSNHVTYTAYFTRPDVFLPGPVTLTDPIGGGDLASNPPTLQWTAPTPEALWYFVEVYRNGAIYLQNSIETDAQWALPDGLPPGNYTWRVRPWNNAGNGYWTGEEAFTVPSTLSPTPNTRDVLSVYRPNTGVWSVRDTVLDTADQFNWGWSKTTPVAADYNGDGVTDPSVYYPTGGVWYILDGATGVPREQNWGWAQALPVPGDYDGDGNADLGVYDPATGDWYVRTLDGTVLAWEENWGWPKAVPVPGDYDGDGDADLAVYDPATGDWYVRTLDGTVLAWEENWGWPKAVPAPGDYDNDGSTDLAVYDSATGDWYARTLGGAVLAWQKNWGFAGAASVPGDYDGDGRADLAVYHKTNGDWYISTLDGTVLAWAENWGGADALPSATQYWLNQKFGLE